MAIHSLNRIENQCEFFYYGWQREHTDILIGCKEIRSVLFNHTLIILAHFLVKTTNLVRKIPAVERGSLPHCALWFRACGRRACGGQQCSGLGPGLGPGPRPCRPALGQVS